VRGVVGEHPEQHPRHLLLARGVGLAGAHDRRRHEVALRRRGLHDEARAEQLAHERLEHGHRGEHLLAPVADAGEALDQLARRLPDRVVLPGVLVSRAVESVDLLRQGEVVEDQVLRKAQLVQRADRQRVVDHVRRRVALRGRVDVQPEPVLGMRPREHVPLEHLHPLRVHRREHVRRAAVLDVLRDLADDVRVVAVDRLLPLLVRIEELVPVGALEGGPLLGIAADAVGELVNPAL
jgi:hypothetical protein